MRSKYVNVILYGRNYELYEAVAKKYNLKEGDKVDDLDKSHSITTDNFRESEKKINRWIREEHAK